MKSNFVFLFFMLFTTSIFAQRIPFNVILTTATLEVEKYDIHSLNENQCFLKLGYGKYGIANPEVKKQFYGKQIESIELIYTAHNNGGNFSQKDLNLKRLKQLYSFAPELFEYAYTDWKIISQTGCKSDQTCLSFFHGFVITYKPAFTEADRKEEITELKTVFDDLEKIDEKGKESVSEDILNSVTDKVVFDVFKRKKKEWKNALVVVDATGSMSPYIQQMLLWLRLNEAQHNIKYITFFNDGDYTADHLKQAGHTGGIYHTKVNSFVSIKDKLSECMQNGFGGDAPENDLEAVLESMKTFTDYDEVVLIADNWANMRDYMFTKKIKKPVRVVLCGVQNEDTRFNLQYLNLAYQTKGSIHTISEDIEQLYKMQQGDTIVLNKETFYLSPNNILKSKNISNPWNNQLSMTGLGSDIDKTASTKTINYLKYLIKSQKDLEHVKFSKRSISNEGILVFDYKGKHFEYDLNKLVKVTLVDNHKSFFDYDYQMYTYDYTLKLEFADSKSSKHIYRIAFRSKRTHIKPTLERWSIDEYDGMSGRFSSIRYVGALKNNFEKLARINRGE